MIAVAAAAPVLASLRVGPVQFEAPVWLWLIPIGWALAVWIGRKSLSGLAGTTRRVALAVRLLVIALFACALAEPQWRTESKDVAITAILDYSRSIPPELQERSKAYVEAVATVKGRQAEDRLGVVTAAQGAYVASLPSKVNTTVQPTFIGATEGTNLAEALRLAMATRPQDAAYRIVMFTDGNETAGSILQAAEAAKAAGVPIDVMPLRYAFDREVTVENLVAPATARAGENINLRVVLHATKPTSGRLTVTMNGEPVDLDPESEGVGIDVRLNEGRNVLGVPINVAQAVTHRFEAYFEPLEPSQDAIKENNRALAVTFVSGEGKVLVVTESTEEAAPLVAALSAAKIAADVTPASSMPRSLDELGAYHAIVLVNEPAYNFSQQAQEELRQYVHDLGGGLVMIGGPEAFGAGGWIGSPVEDALPIKLDVPQKRQMPRGALALIMHSIEMPEGVYYGQKTAEAAVDALSRLDLIGIVEYDWRQGVAWVHPLQEVGDGAAVRRAIQNLTFGDMPDFAPSMELALQGLAKANAGVKHAIIISDGDPQPPSRKLLQLYNKERITISTVGVFPHTPGDLRSLQNIATMTGGRYYEVTTKGQLGEIVQIFVKEAQTVRRSQIWEGDPFVPSFTGIPSEAMRGIGSLPPIRGYVVGGEREGLALTILKGQENDPVLAQWQYGLGKSVAFTSDATSRWAADWVAWPGFRAFWEQHVRWAMRPGGSANVRVTTENVGDRTRVIIDAMDASGERLNFASFRGRVAGPGGEGQDITATQVGPGRYEASFDSSEAGSYVLSMIYAAPAPGGGDPLEGSVQAAVTRPFADEFRSLRDNTPLLQQVAAMTGGRDLSLFADRPEDSDLWTRAGLTMPVATRPIWLAVLMTAIGVFLVDVGVRRVRIDVPAMARAVRGAFAKGKVRTTEGMGALQAARAKAREGMAARGGAGAAGGGGEAGVPLAQASKATAGVKFEATAEQLRRKPEAIALGGEPEAPAKPAPIEKKQTKASEEEEGMSRLMAAKKRARGGLDDKL